MKLKRLSPLIGIIILLYILYTIDPGKLVDVIEHSDRYYLMIAGSVSLSTILIMNLRWMMIISDMGMKTDFFLLLKSLSKGIALGVITPGRIGELYRAKYLKDITKESSGQNISTVIVDRILDIITLLFLGGIGSYILVRLFLVDIPLWATLLLPSSVCLLLVIFFAYHPGTIRKFIRPVFDMFVPKKKKDGFRLHFDDFFRGLEKLSATTYLKGFLYTLLIWLSNIIALYLVSESIGLGVALWYIALISPVITLINLIPISVSGLGTIQASCIFLLGLAGVAAEQALAFSFLFIIISLWVYALPGIILFILKK